MQLQVSRTAVRRSSASTGRPYLSNGVGAAGAAGGQRPPRVESVLGPRLVNVSREVSSTELGVAAPGADGFPFGHDAVGNPGRCPAADAAAAWNRRTSVSSAAQEHDARGRAARGRSLTAD